MSTDLVPANTDQTLESIRTVRGVLAPDLNDAELALFAMVATRSGLDPFAKQIYAVKRAGRVTFQTGIDGYRSIAARTGQYDGQDEPQYGPTLERPFPHPEWATVRVYRKGMARAVAATAYWDEYVPQGNQGQMWQRMPRVMLAKCAEALALRKAFPWDPTAGHGIGADLYTAEEMAQADRLQSEPEPVVRPSLAERAAQRAAVVAAPVAPETVAEPVEEAVVRDEPARATCGHERGDGPVCTLAPGHVGPSHRMLNDEGRSLAAWPLAN